MAKCHTGAHRLDTIMNVQLYNRSKQSVWSTIPNIFKYERAWQIACTCDSKMYSKYTDPIDSNWAVAFAVSAKEIWDFRVIDLWYKLIISTHSQVWDCSIIRDLFSLIVPILHYWNYRIKPSLLGQGFSWQIGTYCSEQSAWTIRATYLGHCYRY